MQAILCVVVGAVLFLTGVAWVWPPAALIAGGAGLMAAGLLVDFEGRR